MRYAKKVVSCILSFCLMLSLLVGGTVSADAAENDPIKITCVGDSITAGYKASSSDKSYPSQMQKILGDGYKVTNVGSSGASIIRSLNEGYSKRDAYRKGLESKPDIVILMMGTNDAILAKSDGKISEERQAEFRKDYIALIEDYKNCGTNPEIILAYPTASVWDNSKNSNYNTPNDRDEMNDKYLIPIIKEIAAEYNLQVLDTHNYTGSWTHPDLLKDGLHPSDAGYRKLAEFFANVIRGNAQGVDGFFETNTAYSIVSKSSGKALSVKNHSTDNSAGLIQVTDQDYESQAWKLVPIDHGYYQIVNRYSGKALDIPNSSKDEGKQIIQWNRGNEKNPNQHWKVEATDDGYWIITSRINPTMVLNVEGNSKNDEAQIVQWGASGADNEKWKLEVIPEVKRIPDGKIRVTCVGDSITDGIGASSGSTNYPAKLQTRLGDGYKVLNKGVSGSKVVRSTKEAYSKTNRYVESIESNPDIVIIMLGTNDAFYTTTNEKKEEFRKDYKALIEDYKNLPTKPKIILASMVSSVGDDNKPDGRDANNAKNQIPIIEELAKEYNLPLLDVNTYTESWTKEGLGGENAYLKDGLHPNDGGYEKLAELFAEAVLEYAGEFTGGIQENTDYSIVAKSSGKAMSIENNSTEGNAKICQMTDEDYESQAWRFLPVKNTEYYIIMNKYTGKVLNIPNNSTNEGTQIIQWGNNGADNELFLIKATSDGYWTISPKLSPQMCLTISKDSKENGGAVIQQKSTGADNQKWKFEVIPKVKRLSEGKITITCVGDSITEGVGSSSGNNYPNQLKKLLGDDYWVYNVGVAGTTMQRSLDLAYSKTSNYKIGLASEPDVVILFLGTNDAPRTPDNKSLEAFRKDYKSLIEEYQNCGTNPKIILASYVTTVKKADNSLDDQDKKNEQALIPIVKELAKEYGLQMLDVHNYTGSWTYEGLKGENPYLSDGLHPNNAGYERLAKLYANAILGYMEGFTGDIQEDTTYTLVSRSSGKALTVKDNSKENNAGLCQMANTKAESQVWKFVPAGHGYYQIVNEATGKALDVPGSSKNAGTQIVQYDKSNKDNQLWKIEATGDGHWVIAPKLSQKLALSVTGDSKDDGAAIVQNTYTDAANGQWKLVAVNEEQPSKPAVGLTSFALEGEVGVLEKEAVVIAADDSSNKYTVRNLGGPNNGTVTYTFNAEAAGKRTLNIYYASDDSNNRKMNVTVNGVSNQVDFEGNGSWSKAGETPKTISINVKEGTNTIQLAGVNGGFTPNVDRLEISLTKTEAQNLVTGLINSIPENVTDSDANKALINGVKLAYDKLDEEAKKQINNADKLNSAMVKLEAAIKGEEIPSTPENPSTSDNPTDPSSPSDSSEPIGESKPSDSSEPTGTADPSQPADPSTSSDPSDVNKPSAPSDSSEPTGENDPSHPSEPIGESEPSSPSEPTNPTVPSEPTPGTSGTPSDPSAPTNPNGGTQQDDSQIVAPGIKVQSIALSGMSRKIAAGKKVKLSVEVTPKDAADKSLIWTTSDERFATVDANGTVTTKKAGKGKKVTVTAAAKDGSGVKATYTIQIMQKAVKKIKLSADSKTLTAGKKMTIKAIVTPSASAKKINNKLSWNSSKPKYASVNSKGVVTAKKAGKGKTVKITAQATDGSGKKAVFKIKID